MYYCDMAVSSIPVYTYHNQLCTKKFHSTDFVSLGLGYEADMFGEMLEFKNN